MRTYTFVTLFSLLLCGSTSAQLSPEEAQKRLEEKENDPAALKREIVRLREDNVRLKSENDQLRLELARLKEAEKPRPAAPVKDDKPLRSVEEIVQMLPKDRQPEKNKGWTTLQVDVANKWFEENAQAKRFDGVIPFASASMNDEKTAVIAYFYFKAKNNDKLPLDVNVAAEFPAADAVKLTQTKGQQLLKVTGTIRAVTLKWPEYQRNSGNVPVARMASLSPYIVVELGDCKLQ